MADDISSQLKRERKPQLTQERLKELLHYDPDTGAFRWRVDKWARGRINVRAGDIAGSRNDSGYRTISIDRRGYRASHLAVLYMNGSLPEAEVDHKDCNPSNDSWDNLRCASSSQNKWNTRVSKNNRSGLKGAFWHKTAGRWRSQIMKHGKLVHLGIFDTPEEAHAAYVTAAEEYFGEFARY